MIRLGLAGLGKMGLSHLAILNSHPDISVMGVCDESKLVSGMLKIYSNFNCYNNYEDMLRSLDLDAVVISTPSVFHEDMIQKAIQQKLHIFCEKPLTLDPESSHILNESAESAGLVNQVGYHNRFVGTFVKAKELIDAGCIGKIYHVDGEAYGPVVVKRKSKTWRSKPQQGGGCLYDYASHVINLIEFYLGDIHSVSGSILKSIVSEEVDDAAYSSLFLDHEVTGQLSVNWSDSSYRKMSTRIVLYGQTGKIVVDAHELRIYLQKENRIQNLDRGWNSLNISNLAPPISYYLRGEEYSAQIDHFVQSITQGSSTENMSTFASAASTDAAIAKIIRDAA